MTQTETQTWLAGVVGVKTAAEIVNVFGENTEKVIAESPTFLSQVKGVGRTKIEKIRAAYCAR